MLFGEVWDKIKDNVGDFDVEYQKDPESMTYTFNHEENCTHESLVNLNEIIEWHNYWADFTEEDYENRSVLPEHLQWEGTSSRHYLEYYYRNDGWKFYLRLDYASSIEVEGNSIVIEDCFEERQAVKITFYQKRKEIELKTLLK